MCRNRSRCVTPESVWTGHTYTGCTGPGVEVFEARGRRAWGAWGAWRGLSLQPYSSQPLLTQKLKCLWHLNWRTLWTGAQPALGTGSEATSWWQPGRRLSQLFWPLAAVTQDWSRQLFPQSQLVPSWTLVLSPETDAAFQWSRVS